MNKQELREIYLKKRIALVNKDELDRKIADLFFTHFSLSSNQIIHIYLPLKKFNEINTNLLIDEFQKRGHCIAIPKIEQEDLLSIELTPETPFEKHDWGLQEPTGGKKIDPHSVDVVIIPLLAYDKKGYRVGYGKGYYDRFLNKCKSEVIKIGLSYFPPENVIDDLTANDVPLNFCLTPEKIYEF